MKKTSLYLDEDTDAALTRKAAHEGVAKAALIRRALDREAAEAPQPRFSGRGVVSGGPPDLAANDEYYLTKTGFGKV